MQTALHQTTFVIVDLETTGASPKKGAAITEIGAVKVRGGEQIGEFSSFVNPLAPIPEYITDMTGITDLMLAHAPVIDEIFPTFLEFAGSHTETVLVAHNAPFDLSFLKMILIPTSSILLHQMNLNISLILKCLFTKQINLLSILLAVINHI